MRLVDYAKAYLVVVPVRDVGDLIARGALSIDGRAAGIADPVPDGAVVAVDDAALAACALRPQPLPLVVCHEDDDLLVCDKPAGMHVHPLGPHREDTLLNALLWHCGARGDRPWGRWRPHPLHRLDRAASGLVAIGKRAAIHDDMRRQFAEHAIERRYLARVHGRVDAEAGTIASPLGRDPTCDYRRAVVPVADGGQAAVTHFKRLEQAGEHTLLELTLETGRTHQIRAHLASIGHPIVGDTLYAPGGDRRDAASAISLHATELRLRHPQHGTIITCTAKNLPALVARLSLALLVACHSSAPVATPPAPRAPPVARDTEPGYELPAAGPVLPFHDECRQGSGGGSRSPGVTIYEFETMPIYPVRRGPHIADRPHVGGARKTHDLRTPFFTQGDYITACWKWASARGAKPMSLDVALTIDPFGQTHDVHITAAEPGADELIGCVSPALAARWVPGMTTHAAHLTATVSFVLADQPGWKTKPARPPLPAAAQDPFSGKLCLPVADDGRVDDVRLPFPLTVTDADAARDPGRGRAPSLRIGCPTVMRRLDKRALVLAVESNRGTLQACYRDALDRTPAVAGSITATLVFSASGALASAQTSAPGDATFQACVADAMKALWVDPSDGVTQAIFTFELAPLPAPREDDLPGRLDIGDVDGVLAVWKQRLAKPHTPLDGCRARLGIVHALARAAPWLDDDRVHAAVAELARFAQTLPVEPARACAAEAEVMLREYTEVGAESPVGREARHLARYEAVLPMAALLDWGANLRWYRAEALLLTPRHADGEHALHELASDPKLGAQIRARLEALAKPEWLRDECEH